MAWPTFLFWNALGGIAWAASVALLAYFVGRGAERIVHFIGLGGAALVVAAALVAWPVLRRRRRRAEALAIRRIDG